MLSEYTRTQIKEKRKAGQTMRSIAEEMGVSISTVYNLTRNDVDRRRRITDADKRNILRLRRQGLTIEQITRRLQFCSSWTVWNICNKAGLNNVRLSQK